MHTERYQYVEKIMLKRSDKKTDWKKDINTGNIAGFSHQSKTSNGMDEQHQSMDMYLIGDLIRKMRTEIPKLLFGMQPTIYRGNISETISNVELKPYVT